MNRNICNEKEVTLFEALLPEEVLPSPGISAVLKIKHGRITYGEAVPLNDARFSEKYAPKYLHIRVPNLGCNANTYKEMLLGISPASPSKLQDKEAREALLEKYKEYYPKTEEELYKAVV